MHWPGEKHKIVTLSLRLGQKISRGGLSREKQNSAVRAFACQPNRQIYTREFGHHNVGFNRSDALDELRRL